MRLMRRAAQRYELQVIGYCLMPNHVHLIAVPQREESLGAAVRDAHSDYASKVNLRIERCGHVWQNRYYSCPMDESHLLRALRYVDLNPVRAGLCKDAIDWRWSSAVAHSQPQMVDSLLDRQWRRVLTDWDYAQWRKDLDLVDDELGPLLRQATRSGMPLGSSDFIADMERMADRRLIVATPGRPRGGRGTTHVNAA